MNYNAITMEAKREWEQAESAQEQEALPQSSMNPTERKSLLAA